MTFLAFLLVLSVLVLVHELGHFMAARMFGIKVEEFAFGLPFTKPIFKVRRGETQYSIYPLLFGGFVKLHGEESQGDDKSRSFWNRSRAQRIAVIVAGVIMNVVLAVAAFITLYGVVGVPVGEENKITVVGIIPNSPAQEAGIGPQDRIVEVEGKKIESPDEFLALVKSWAGTGVNLTLENGKTTLLFEGLVEQETVRRVVTVVPRVNPPEGQGALGVNFDYYPYLQTQDWHELGLVRFASLSIQQGFVSTGEWIGKIVDGLRMIGQSLAAGKAPEGVSGPVGIYQLTGMVAEQGFLSLLELVAILSVNLAVFNILPIPALDGGRLAFIGLEMIKRKRISPALEQKVNTWGMIALLAMMAAISLQDVVRLGILDRFLGK